MEILKTFIGSFLFALIFLLGNKLGGLLALSRRWVLSAAAGVTTFYEPIDIGKISAFCKGLI
jgi:hypothetical protein